MIKDLDDEFKRYSNQKRSSILLNASFKWLSILGTLITTFLMTPYIIATIGNYGYGVWLILSSMLGYYGLLTFGIGSAVSRYMSLYLGEGDYPAMLKTFNTAFMVFFVIGVVVAILIYATKSLIASVFQVQDVAQFESLIWIAGLSVALSFPNSILSSAIISHELYVIHSVISLFSVIFRAIISVAFLEYGFSVEGIVFAFLFSVVTDVIISYCVIRIWLPWVVIDSKKFSFITLKVLFIFGLPTVVISLSALLRTDLDGIVIGTLIGVEQVTIYGVSALIVKYIFTFSNTGLSVFTSRYARIVGSGKSADYLFFTSLFFASNIAVISFTSIYLFGESFIKLWLGDGYSESVPILFILMGAYVVTIMQIPGYNYLIALNKHRVFAVIILAEGISNLCLSIILAKEFGIIGVALGTAIPMVIIKIFVQPYYVIKNTGVTFYAYMSSMSPPLIVGLVFMAAYGSIGSFKGLSVNDWGNLILLVVGYVVIFVAISFGITRMFKPDLMRLS